MKQAKLQGIVLIAAMLLLLTWALVSYFKHPPKPQPPKEKPKAVATETPAAAPAAPTETQPPPAPPAEPAPTSAPATSTPSTPSNTLKGADLVKQLTTKPKVAVSEVLGSIGVAESAKMKRDLPKVQEARRVLDLLGKTSYVSGKLEYVINKPGIELRMKDYYETGGLKDPEAGEQVADFEIQMAGERFLDVVYKNPNRPSGTLRASFVRDERGMVRIDWESLVGFSAMPMREFRDKKPETPVTMRVFASVDDYYNYEFTDSKKFLSVRLRNADGSEAVNGYCEAGGRVATAINARLATSGTAEGPASGKHVWAPIIVKARFPKNPQSDHCVELLELMHGQWLAPAGLVE